MRTFKRQLMWIIPSILILLDQIAKNYFRKEYFPGESRAIITNVLNFTYVQNNGAAFGWFQNNRWAFILIVIAVISVLIFLLMRKSISQPFYRWSTVLIIAGGIGNTIDRILYGFVTDFIDTVFFKYPSFHMQNGSLQLTWSDFYVFNIADCCVVIGSLCIIVFLIYETIKEIRDNRKKTEQANADKTVDEL